LLLGLVKAEDRVVVDRGEDDQLRISVHGEPLPVRGGVGGSTRLLRSPG
jgi:hypothetical protein